MRTVNARPARCLVLGSPGSLPWPRLRPASSRARLARAQATRAHRRHAERPRQAVCSASPSLAMQPRPTNPIKCFFFVLVCSNKTPMAEGGGSENVLVVSGQNHDHYFIINFNIEIFREERESMCVSVIEHAAG